MLGLFFLVTNFFSFKGQGFIDLPSYIHNRTVKLTHIYRRHLSIYSLLHKLRQQLALPFSILYQRSYLTSALLTIVLKTKHLKIT